MKISAKNIYTDNELLITLENGSLNLTDTNINSDSNIFISPGFIDLQVNGYKGLDYSSDTLNENDVHKIVEYLAESGTVLHLPTIITGEKNKTLKNIKTIISARKNNKITETAIAGIHLEGPFISRLDGVRGAHDKRFVRSPDINELHEWIKASEGLIKIITIAPELIKSEKFIKEAVKNGINISIGHSDANTRDIEKAVKSGAALSTHLGNGINQMIDRRNNILWEQLANDSLKAGIITDGFHLLPEQIKTFYKAKSLQNIFLVSDAGPLGGKNPGIYKWGNIDVQVFDDGHLGLPGTQYLAGAGHLLDTCIANFLNVSELEIKTAAKTFIDNPLDIIGNKECNKENFVIFEYKKRMTKLNILYTFINNRLIFKK